MLRLRSIAGEGLVTIVLTFSAAVSRTSGPYHALDLSSFNISVLTPDYRVVAVSIRSLSAINATDYSLRLEPGVGLHTGDRFSIATNPFACFDAELPYGSIFSSIVTPAIVAVPCFSVVPVGHDEDAEYVRLQVSGPVTRIPSVSSTLSIDSFQVISTGGTVILSAVKLIDPQQLVYRLKLQNLSSVCSQGTSDPMVPVSIRANPRRCFDAGAPFTPVNCTVEVAVNCSQWTIGQQAFSNTNFSILIVPYLEQTRQPWWYCLEQQHFKEIVSSLLINEFYPPFPTKHYSTVGHRSFLQV